jgi:hypothetical protein
MGHAPPHTAVPKSGSPLVTPHSIGVEVGVAVGGGGVSVGVTVIVGVSVLAGVGVNSQGKTELPVTFMKFCRR